MSFHTLTTFQGTPVAEDLAPIYALRAFGEDKAAKQLAEVGIACWAPKFKRFKPAPRGTFREVEAPLIPGYVFARLGEADFAAALATERVFGVVSNAGAPVAIPEAEWVKVILMVMSGKFDERTPTTKARPRGQRKKGLSGLSAWFDRYTQAS